MRPGGGEPGAEAPEVALVGQVVVLVPERLRALGGRVVVVLEAPAVDRVVARVEVQGPELGVAGHLGRVELDPDGGPALLERRGGVAPAAEVGGDLGLVVDPPGVDVRAEVRLPARQDDGASARRPSAGWRRSGGRRGRRRRPRTGRTGPCCPTAAAPSRPPKRGPASPRAATSRRSASPCRRRWCRSGRCGWRRAGGRAGRRGRGSRRRWRPRPSPARRGAGRRAGRRPGRRGPPGPSPGRARRPRGGGRGSGPTAWLPHAQVEHLSRKQAS